jgi:putative polyketide hydroxylase
MNEQVTEVPVLIVGAGPAGLTAAIALAQAGVECRLVERREDMSSLPRATVISTRSMEIYRSWGLEEQLLAGGHDVQWQQWLCETLAQVADGSPLPTGLPTKEQSAVISPTAPACVPQDHLERVLMDHLCSLAPSAAELGIEVTRVEVSAAVASARLRDVRTGRARHVRARYLVAADGAHSFVRKSLGIPMNGSDRLFEAATALFRAPLWPIVGDHRFGLYFTTHPEASGTFLPAGRPDRWLHGVIWEPGAMSADDFPEAEFTRRIRIGSGVTDLEPRIERIGSFTFAAQMAERFRHECAFLVGDAAHRVTPRGGTGMNTAIHDGFDLGWKLAWVLNGWDDPALLDTYEAERRPVAQHNVSRSADPDGSTREPVEEMHVDLGGRIPHMWVASDGGRSSTIDLLGTGVTVFTGPNGSGGDGVGFHSGAVPLTTRRLDRITARALGVPAGGGLAVRPDGRGALVPSTS